MTKTAKTTANLRLIDGQTEVYELMKPPATTAERIHGLQAQARALAVEETARLETALREAARLAAQIAGGGDAYPVGAREMASRLTSKLAGDADTLKAIAARTLA